MKTKAALLTIVLAVIMSVGFSSHAASKSKQDTSTIIRQYSKSISLLNSVAATITIVDYQSEEGRINSLINQLLDRARILDTEINGYPNGEVEKINSAGKKEAVILSDDMFALLNKSKYLAAMTKGWFDIAAPEEQGWLQARDYRKIKLNEEDKTVTLKSDDMNIDIRNIWPAYLADKLMVDIINEGIGNAKVEVGIVSRNIGHDIHTPWRVSLDLLNPESQYAYRSFVYSFSNKAVALLNPRTLTTPVIDPKTRTPVPNHFQNVMVFGNDSMTASALALALYTMGPKDAKNFTERHPEIKSIMVDENGEFINSKNFQVGRRQYAETSLPQTNGGANAEETNTEQ